MSFGPNQATKDAASRNADIAKTAQTNSAAQTAQGTGLVNSGTGTVQSGTNFFNTLLNGNRADTTALLQPNIDQIREANTNNIHAISTLSPRGGGRFGTLFGSAYSPTQQINNLYNGARSGAAGNLAQIGLGQQGVGTSLIGQGNGLLNTGSSTNNGLLNYGLAQQQQTNAAWSGLGQGIAGLATLPFGASGTSLLGRI